MTHRDSSQSLIEFTLYSRFGKRVFFVFLLSSVNSLDDQHIGRFFALQFRLS